MKIQKNPKINIKNGVVEIFSINKETLKLNNWREILPHNWKEILPVLSLLSGIGITMSLYISYYTTNNTIGSAKYNGIRMLCTTNNLNINSKATSFNLSNDFVGTYTQFYTQVI